MEEDFFDISQTGGQGYRELQQQNNYLYDDGFISLAKPTSDKSGKKSSKQDKKKSVSQKDILDYYSPMMSEKAREATEKYYEENPWAENYDNPVNDLMFEAQRYGDRGYRELGKRQSRFDDRINDPTDWADIENYRGKMQSGAEQLTKGLLKMGVVAGTTMADNFVGIPAGIINMAVQGMMGNIHNAADLGDAFIENPISKWLVGLQEASDNWLPVYETEQERNAPWYQKFWHANFIGDHFMKNTGFLVGAILSGRASAGVLSKLMKTNEARNIFKNTALAAGLGENVTPKEVLDAYRSGKVIGSEAKVSEALAQAAKNAKRADRNLMLVSNAIGSFGESRMEAITNSNDWFENVKTNLDKDKADQLQNVDAQIYQDHPELFDVHAIIGPDGSITGYQTSIINQEAYNAEHNRIVAEIENRYDDALAEASKQRVNYANASFGINFLLTFGENVGLIGDAMTGSWSKRAMFNNRIKQAAKKDGLSAGIKEAGTAIREGAESLGKQWKANPWSVVGDITKSFARGPFWETNQEMLQAATGIGLNRRAGSRLNTYYGDIVDKDGLYQTTNGFRNFLGAISDTYTSPEQWENGALGFVTALLPIPTKVMTTNKVERDENGNVSIGDKFKNFRKSWSFGGEFWGAIGEARENYRKSQGLASALNDLEKDNVRLNQFYSAVKQDRLNALQQQALDDGNQKTYKDIEADKLIDNVMTYIDAGQYDYLKELVEEAFTVETPEQIQSLKSMMIYDDNGVQRSLLDGMSDEEIIKYYSDQKEKVLDKIQRFHDIYENINKVYGDFGGGENSSAYVKTLAYDIMSIDDREDRIKSTSKEVLDDFRQYAEQFKAGISNYELTDDQKKQLDEIDKSLKALDDITKLNIALGNDGFLDKLDNIRQNQKMTLEEKFEHVNDLINSEQELLEKRIRQKKKRSDVRRRLVDYYDYLGFVKEKLDKVNTSVESTTKNIDISKKIDDLLDLLGDREMLYNQLAIMSGIGGQELFLQGLSMDIAVLMDDYHERYSQKYYDKFKESHDLDDVSPSVLGIVRSIAKKQKDQTTERYIDLYEKYIFGKNSLINVLPEEYQDSLNFIYAGLKQVISSSEDPEKAQEDILGFFRSQIQDEGLLGAIEQFENDIKKSQERKEQTDGGISGDGEPKENKPNDNDDEYGVFSDEGFNFNQIFKSGNTNLATNYLKAMAGQSSNAKLFQKLAERLGYDEDETVSYEEYVNSIAQNNLDKVIDELENLYNEYLELGNSSQDKTPEEVPEEPEEPKGESEEGSEGEPEPEETYDEDVFTLDDSNKDRKDNVSQVQSTGDNIKVVNDKGFTIDPQQSGNGLRAGAENAIDDKYVDGQGNDLFTDDTAKVPDVWNVNRSSLYDYEKLKDRRLRKLVKYIDSSGRLNPSSFTKWLNDEYKVQEFIDSGFLAKVVEKGGNTIRFVGVNNPDFLDERRRNDTNVQYKLNETLFAAIEIPSELREQYDSAGFKLIDFKDQNGNTIPMQILGVIMPQPKKDGGKDKYLEDKKTGVVRRYKDGSFQNLIDSVYLERKRIFSKNGNNTQFLAYSYTSEIDYIFPGRFVKQTENIGYGERMLSDILTNEEKENPEWKLQLSLYIKDDDSIKIGRSIEGEEVPLNTFSFDSESARLSGRHRTGSVWIMTKEADGKIYHKGARLIDFDSNFYGKYRGSNSNPYLNGIRNAVRKIISAKSNEQIMDALHEIQKYLYFNNGHEMFIRKAKSGKIFLIINNGKNRSTSIDLSDENAFDKVMNAIVAKKYKFSLGDTTLKEVVDSNIIYTDLAELHNRNASFTINKVVDGKSVKPKEKYDSRSLVNEQYEEQADTRNGNVYYITSDKKQKRYKVFYKQKDVRYVSNDKPVTDHKEVAIALRCFELETQKGELKSDVEIFQNTNNASAQKTLHVVKFIDKSGQPSTAAFIYSKYGGKVSVTVLDQAETNLVSKIMFEGYKPDSSDDASINNIKSLMGISTTNKISKAVKDRTGVKEQPKQEKKEENIIPDYVKQHQELKDVYFKVGDIITGNDMFDNFEGIVQKIYEDGRIDVLITNRNLGVIQFSPYAVTNFFGLTNNAADTEFHISTKTNTNEAATETIEISSEQFKKKTDTKPASSDEQKRNDIVNTGGKKVGKFQFTNESAKKFYKKFDGADRSKSQNSRIEDAKLKIAQNKGFENSLTWDQLKQIIDSQSKETIEELNKLFDKAFDSKLSKEQRNENFEKFANALESLKC